MNYFTYLCIDGNDFILLLLSNEVIGHWSFRLSVPLRTLMGRRSVLSFRIVSINDDGNVRGINLDSVRALRRTQSQTALKRIPPKPPQADRQLRVL